MFKIKIDEHIVAAFEAASKNEVAKIMLKPCCFCDGYFVFPKNRIKNKKLVKHLIATGKLELAD